MGQIITVKNKMKNKKINNNHKRSKITLFSVRRARGRIVFVSRVFETVPVLLSMLWFDKFRSRCPESTEILSGKVMQSEKDEYFVKSKVWIEDSKGEVVFGRGRYLILDAIGRLGSLQAAAKELKMSYRAVWCRVKASEERIGKPLVVREGRGSRLTVHAEELMKQYKRLQSVVEKESDEVYVQLMSDSLE